MRIVAIRAGVLRIRVHILAALVVVIRSIMLAQHKP